MSDAERVVVLGGHGKVALLTAPKLTSAGYSVDSVIRDPAQSADVEAAGGNPVVLDIERADVEALTEAFDGARAVVFAAGAGGGDPARTARVDHEAAVRAMRAAEKAGVRRFVIVSYAGAWVDVDRIDPDNPFYAYAKAKHDADAHLRGTELDFTILGPGNLTLEPATGKIRLADADGTIDGRQPGDEGRTSRDNVAEVITHVITANAGIRQTVNFYDGPTPIPEALP
ncbi:NAD(P)H-binding protein [Nocardiopsis tropica]|uniref:NAD(P)H-binding protein n=1 Tax=Nocardiopsis tropica TaxID=109330 RepID=A0ABV2A2Z7_9ACTN